jgi:teichuronic acid exporter
MQSSIWVFMRRFGQTVLQFVTTMCLARLLMPEHFALIGMLEIFLTVSQRLIYSGSGEALIQKKEIKQTDLSTLFWYNNAISFLCYVFLFLSAPFIARFFNQADLTNILRLSALGLLLKSLTVVHGVRFARKLDFKIPTLVGLLGTVFYGFIGIILALYEFGVWSIVIARIARLAMEAVIHWAIGKWHPSFVFSVDSMKQIIKFGGPILAANLLGALFNNIHVVLIGKFYPLAALGLFNRGRAVQQIATDLTNQPVQSILLPTFSRLQNEPVRLASAYLRVLQMLAFMLFPVLFLTATAAEPIILLIYTDKWAEAIPFLQWLAFTGPFIPITNVMLNVKKSTGQSISVLRLHIVRHFIVLIAVGLTFNHSINAVIIGMGLANLIMVLILVFVIRRFIPIGFLKQCTAIFGPMAIATVSSVLSYWFSNMENFSMFSEMCVVMLVFIPTYLILSIIFKLAALGNLLTLSANTWNKWNFSRQIAKVLQTWLE